MKHNYAISLEYAFRDLFGLKNRGGLGGLVDADQFEHAAVNLSIMLLSKKIIGTDVDGEAYQALKKFISDYKDCIDLSMHNMDETFIETLVNQVKGIISLIPDV